MSYKIAVASSDELNVDETFGQARRFIIYEADGREYKKLEERVVEDAGQDGAQDISGVGGSEPAGCNPDAAGCDVNSGCSPETADCGSGDGCGSGGGCGNGGGANHAKLSLVLDCRALVCKKIGFSVQKQLEKKAISSFDVACPIEEALDKITFYYNRMDNHQSLRG
ncbi:MAG: hypothetical protein IJ763_00830 [Lachnospiraceae bacterium]|nr:hypothetical protein [Lachnospiraceae bacterium]